MTMKNEAVRLFLAMTALILTAMLTNPLAEQMTTEPTPAAAQTANDKKVAITKHHTRVTKNALGIPSNYRQIRKLSQR